MLHEITGFSNLQVKRVRALRDKKARREEGLFLAEGLRILAEARDAGRLPEALWLSSAGAAHPMAKELMAATEASGGSIYLTSADILSKISGKDNPQTVLGVYAEHWTALDSLDRSSADIWIVAERLRDPGNLGTILRTGDAVGAGGLILVGDCTDPFSVEAVRASMGALFTQKIVRAGWEAFTDWLRTGPGELIGTSLNTALDYQQPHYTRPAFILIGNESQGMPAPYETACDTLVKMPMLGKADSLNAAMACAVMAYEVRNQFRQAVIPAAL